MSESVPVIAEFQVFLTDTELQRSGGPYYSPSTLDPLFKVLAGLFVLDV